MAVGLAGCGGGDEPSGAAETSEAVETPSVSAACRGAFEDAAAVGEMQDTVSDLYPAVEACSSVDEWSTGGTETGAFDSYSVGPEELLGNVCQAPEVADAPLCEQVGS